MMCLFAYEQTPDRKSRLIERQDSVTALYEFIANRPSVKTRRRASSAFVPDA